MSGGCFAMLARNGNGKKHSHRTALIVHEGARFMFAPFFAIFQFDAAGGFVGWVFWLAVLGFSIWMVVDCWQRGNATWWIFIILFFQPIGALVYFVTQYWDSTRLEHGLWQRLTIGSRIRDVKARAHYLDTSTAFAELGDLYA